MSAGNFFRTSAFALSTLLMVSCESPNSPHPEAAPPDAAKPAAAAATGPVTGRTAYWEMYKMARQWAPDIVPLSLASKPVPGHKIEGGKAMAWAASFGSNAKKEVRGFTYSVIAAEGIVKGVEAERARDFPLAAAPGTVLDKFQDVFVAREGALARRFLGRLFRWAFGAAGQRFYSFAASGAVSDGAGGLDFLAAGFFFFVAFFFFGFAAFLTPLPFFLAFASNSSRACSKVTESGSVPFGKVAISLPCCTNGPHRPTFWTTGFLSFGWLPNSLGGAFRGTSANR